MYSKPRPYRSCYYAIKNTHTPQNVHLHNLKGKIYLTFVQRSLTYIIFFTQKHLAFFFQHNNQYFLQCFLKTKRTPAHSQHWQNIISNIKVPVPSHRETQREMRREHNPDTASKLSPFSRPILKIKILFPQECIIYGQNDNNNYSKKRELFSVLRRNPKSVGFF